MNTQNLAQKGNSMANRWFMNPMVRKLNRVNEQDIDNSATYTGVGIKTVWFLITTIAGVALYFILHNIIPANSEMVIGDTASNGVELIVVLIAAVLFILTPFIAFLIRPVIPVVGSLYCISTGFLICFFANSFGAEYKEIVWLALGITIILVLTMALLYQTGIIKIGHKFRTIVTCLFAGMILSSIAVAIMSVIPFTRPLAQFVSNNILNSVIGSVIFIIIGCLMLLTDFDSVKNTVENHLPKKYEWLAAFSLAYTVIWLYLKVLDLLARAKSND